MLKLPKDFMRFIFRFFFFFCRFDCCVDHHLHTHKHIHLYKFNHIHISKNYISFIQKDGARHDGHGKLVADSFCCLTDCHTCIHCTWKLRRQFEQQRDVTLLSVSEINWKQMRHSESTDVTAALSLSLSCDCCWSVCFNCIQVRSNNCSRKARLPY